MYIVIKTFRDKDDKKVYKEGDKYPTKGKPKERIAYLKSDKTALGEPVIKYQK